MQKKPQDRQKEKYPERTLKGLKEQYEKFKAAGGDRKKQADYENVVEPAIMPIEPKDWALPGLHITMGVVPRGHKHLIIDLSGLDLDLANELAKFDWSLGNSQFDKYIYIRRDIQRTEEQLLEIEDVLDDISRDSDGTVTQYEVNEFTRKLNSEKAVLEGRKSKLEAKLQKPKDESGPIAACLDPLLKSFGIERSPYHGKTFIGNHCDKYLKEETYNGVLDGMVEVVKTLTGNSDIIERAEQIAVKYKGFFKRYAKVYRLTSHSQYIHPSTLPQIQDAIDEFMAYYRSEFSNYSVPLKFHLLEDHAVEWFKRYPFGFGLLGEQGAESVHAVVNRLKVNFRAMRSDVKRLKTTMEEQHMKCAPQLEGRIPERRRYKKN